ncbi:MAG: murein L,D-transpeptidase catalytic domain family protein, partial [Bdellovibrionales bacterium]|nr:murein L,D-transpeptidase catalytic domain family protein [Bdellovibrionales bacterium]
GMFNLKLKADKNSIKYARYYSNELGSNAPSSGFFIAGREYEGKFGRSLTLHGLENGINDNACERAVVIHKHLLISKSQAFAMSSGCPMISKSYLDHVINLLEGKVNPDSGEETFGSLVLIYGQREAAWQSSTCEGNFSI